MTESEIKGRKRVVWDKTETASLIDLVLKNPAIWNTKSKDYMVPAKKGADLWPQIAATKIGIQQLSLR